MSTQLMAGGLRRSWTFTTPNNRPLRAIAQRKPDGVHSIGRKHSEEVKLDHKRRPRLILGLSGGPMV